MYIGKDILKENIMKNFAENRKARFEYFIEKSFEAGLMLVGSEVKAIRAGRANIGEAYIIERNGELLIQNAHISENSQTGSAFQHDPLRVRKILLNRKEINEITGKLIMPGYTVAIMRLYPVGSLIKAEIAICKGKAQYDKRQTIKDRENQITIQRAMKGDY